MQLAKQESLCSRILIFQNSPVLQNPHVLQDPHVLQNPDIPESSCSRILMLQNPYIPESLCSRIPVLQNPCAPGRGAAEFQHQTPQDCCRRSTQRAQGSGGDEEVGSDLVQVWPCPSSRGLKFPEVTGNLPGQGKVLGLVCITEHLKEPKQHLCAPTDTSRGEVGVQD